MGEKKNISWIALQHKLDKLEEMDQFSGKQHKQ